MAASLETRLTGLATMSRAQLVDEWRLVVGTDAPGEFVNSMLARGIAYGLQAKAHGGLALRHARELRTISLRTGQRHRSVCPGVGTRLIREWHGRTHQVTVLEDGFDYDGRRYRSLSVIAREITGARWSGPRFFGLTASLVGAAE